MDLMTIDEFMTMTTRNPLDWITYCEILITESGGILLARPSHTTAAVNYAKIRYGFNETEIPMDCSPLEWMVDKYRMAAVWHCGYLCHHRGLNKFQRRVIDKLIRHRLIDLSDVSFINYTSEYIRYLKRKEMGLYGYDKLINGDIV